MSSFSIPGIPAGSAAAYMMAGLIFMIIIDLVFVFLYGKSFKDIEQQKTNELDLE